jgi:hypothetical protein
LSRRIGQRASLLDADASVLDQLRPFQRFGFDESVILLGRRSPSKRFSWLSFPWPLRKEIVFAQF